MYRLNGHPCGRGQHAIADQMDYEQRQGWPRVPRSAIKANSQLSVDSHDDRMRLFTRLATKGQPLTIDREPNWDEEKEEQLA